MPKKLNRSEAGTHTPRNLNSYSDIIEALAETNPDIWCYFCGGYPSDGEPDPQFFLAEHGWVIAPKEWAHHEKDCLWRAANVWVLRRKAKQDAKESNSG